MIPFAPPYIDQDIIDEVVDTLRSGWITTGPKTKLFENNLAEFCGGSNVLCLNSATAGLEIMLRWFGVKEGDEVIIFETNEQLNQLSLAMETIPYEVLTGISSRVKRVYVQE